MAIHQPAELAADREPKSGASVFRGRGRVRLTESLEQPGHLFRRHSYPGVLDRKNDFGTFLISRGWVVWIQALSFVRVDRFPGDSKDDGAVLGEFAGVPQEI